MASYYVWSGATGTGTGATWANAYTTLTLALASKVAGDIFYVAHDHAETSATAVTLGGFGSGLLTITQVLCVNRAGSVPPVSADLRTTATVTTTGAIALTVSLNAYWYGITFACGTGVTAANLSLGSATAAQSFVNCKFRLLTTAAGSRINMASSCIWTNVVVELANAGQRLAPAGFFS